jgi:protein phosphatase
VDDHTQVFGGSKGKLLLVADGMGGHAAGERASTLAVDTLTTYLLNSLHWMFRLHSDNEDDFVEELIMGLKNCQQAVLSEGELFPDRRGMGTTLTIAYIIWPRVYVVHVGDSRCYLMRNRELRQITKDHTMAQHFVDRGKLDPQQAEQSKWSHMVWNVLGGTNDDLTPQVSKFELHVGDGLLLCTDGLTKHLEAGETCDCSTRNRPRNRLVTA